MRAVPFFHQAKAHPLFPVFALAGALLSGSLTEAQEKTDRQLSMEEAEQLALQANPTLSAIKGRADGALLSARAGLSRMLPSVYLTDEYQHWNSPFSISFPSASPDMPPAMFTARDQDSHTFTATVRQPLLGLLQKVDEYRAQRRNAAATAAQLKVAEESLRQGVRIAYIRHFEAQALEEIARQSEKELAEQITIAEAKLKAGVLTNADLLRVKVAAANAQQQEIVAHTQAAVARATILITAGLTPDDAVTLVEPAALLAKARGESLGYRAAVEHAMHARPELRVAQLGIEASKAQQRARFFALLPEINLEGGYIHIDGQVFAPRDAAFIGLRSTWLLWDFGATWFGYRAAGAQAEVARQELFAQRRQIATEVAAELMQSQSAKSAVRLAEQSIESAAEAYRVTDALVKAGSATTTDLLESQAALNQARLNLVRAQYQLAQAYVAVQHATGNP